ncbi:MAG: DUF547 domain-containing protein [Candidatus Sumerlaeia bacterium]
MRTSIIMVGLLMILCLPAFLAFGQDQKDLDYGPYAEVLGQYVNEKGLVDYKGLKANRAKLDGFLDTMGKLDRAAHDAWSEDAQIALWINAYNATTLRAIIDHYPIQAGGLSAWLHPDNSIRQIDGVWDDLEYSIMGKDYTIGGIEHEVLRKDFQEPRIHMAIVCAAMGCPILRNEPYRGGKLDRQLEEQGRHFLKRDHALDLDRQKNRLHLSPIFKWFGEDFEWQYGRELDKYDETEEAIIDFIVKHVEPEVGDYILKEKPKIKFQDYDWSLNEQ